MNKMKAAFPPGFIHSYDAALLKTAFMMETSPSRYSRLH